MTSHNFPKFLASLTAGSSFCLGVGCEMQDEMNYLIYLDENVVIAVHGVDEIVVEEVAEEVSDGEKSDEDSVEGILEEEEELKNADETERPNSESDLTVVIPPVSESPSIQVTTVEINASSKKATQVTVRRHGSVSTSTGNPGIKVLQVGATDRSRTTITHGNDGRKWGSTYPNAFRALSPRSGRSGAYSKLFSERRWSHK